MRVATIVVMNQRLTLNRFLIESHQETAGNDPDAHLICVDNGSTDGTEEFLDAALAAGHVSEVLHLKRNVFLGPAWNQAADELAQDFDLVGKVDNDSYFKPGWLEELRRVATLVKPGAIICTDAHADWAVIYRQRGDKLERLIEASIKPGNYLHKGGDFGGSYYLAGDLIRDGLRLPGFKRMSIDTNTRVMKAVRAQKRPIVRLRPGYMTWEKLRWTDPSCKAYYDRTFKARGITNVLAARRKRERGQIKAGKLDAYWEEEPCPASS